MIPRASRSLRLPELTGIGWPAEFEPKLIQDSLDIYFAAEYFQVDSLIRIALTHLATDLRAILRGCDETTMATEFINTLCHYIPIILSKEIERPDITKVAVEILDGALNQLLPRTEFREMITANPDIMLALLDQRCLAKAKKRDAPLAFDDLRR